LAIQGGSNNVTETGGGGPAVVTEMLCFACFG